MANWQEILKKKFGETEKKVFLDNELWITIKKIDALRRKELTNFVGQIITSAVDPKNPDKSLVVQQFTEQYDEASRKHWEILFEYGIDDRKHNFGDNVIFTIKFWQDFAREYPDAFSMIEKEIKDFNGVSVIAETEKKTLKKNRSI